MAPFVRGRLPRGSGAEVEWLPGAGHTPILEEPRRTAALLLDFAEKHMSPAPGAP